MRTALLTIFLFSNLCAIGQISDTLEISSRWEDWSSPQIKYRYEKQVLYPQLDSNYKLRYLKSYEQPYDNWESFSVSSLTFKYENNQFIFWDDNNPSLKYNLFNYNVNTGDTIEIYILHWGLLEAQNFQGSYEKVKIDSVKNENYGAFGSLPTFYFRQVYPINNLYLVGDYKTCTVKGLFNSVGGIFIQGEPFGTSKANTTCLKFQSDEIPIKYPFCEYVSTVAAHSTHIKDLIYNPETKEFLISDGFMAIQLLIFDLAGRKICTSTFQDGRNLTKCPAKLREGSYIVEIIGKNSSIKKLMFLN